MIKRDGTTQRFDRRKLLRGLVRAAGGRPVGGEQLEELADSIAASIRRGGQAVQAERIGDLAERGLARLDPVTAIQFASVYRRLSDLDELEAVVRKLRDEPDPGSEQMPFEGIVEERSPGVGRASTADEPSIPSDETGSIASPADSLAGHANVTRRGHAE